MELGVCTAGTGELVTEKMVTVLSGVSSLSIGFHTSLLELALQLLANDKMELSATCNTGTAVQMKIQKTLADMILFNVEGEDQEPLLEQTENQAWKCHFSKIDGPVYHYTQRPAVPAYKQQPQPVHLTTVPAQPVLTDLQQQHADPMQQKDSTETVNPAEFVEHVEMQSYLAADESSAELSVPLEVQAVKMDSDSDEIGEDGEGELTYESHVPEVQSATLTGEVMYESQLVELPPDTGTVQDGEVSYGTEGSEIARDAVSGESGGIAYMSEVTQMGRDAEIAVMNQGGHVAGVDSKYASVKVAGKGGVSIHTTHATAIDLHGGVGQPPAVLDMKGCVQTAEVAVGEPAGRDIQTCVQSDDMQPMDEALPPVAQIHVEVSEAVMDGQEETPEEATNSQVGLGGEKIYIPASKVNMVTPWDTGAQTGAVPYIESDPVALADGASTPVLHLTEGENISLPSGADIQTLIAIKAEDGTVEHFAMADLSGGAVPSIAVKTEEQLVYEEQSEAVTELDMAAADTGEGDAAQTTFTTITIPTQVMNQSSRGRQKLVLDPVEAEGMPTRQVPRIVKDVMVYPCYSCKKRYTKLQSLQTHIARIHRQEYDPTLVKTEMMVNSHLCFICNQVYPDYNALYKHLKRVHKTGGAFRTNCKAGDHGVETVECLICSRSFIRYHTLITHIKKCHADDPDKQKALYHLDDIRYQRRTKKGRITSTCPYCSQEFNGVEVYRHMSRYHGDAEDYKKKVKLVKKEYHTKMKPFMDDSGYEKVACTECGAVVMKRNLAKHMRSACGKKFNGGPKMSCPKCDKKIVKTGLSNHLKYKCLGNTKKKEWTCEYCGQVFDRPTPYQNHIREEHRRKRTHRRLNEWRYCEICKEEIHAEWLGMRQHKRKEHGVVYDDVTLEQEVICSTCGENIAGGLETLPAHKKAAHREKIIICELCNVELAGNSIHLSAHKRDIHNTLFEHFKCNLCDKLFQNRNTLTWHMKGVHSDRKHECTECGKSFKLIYSLRYHLKTVHERNYPYNCDSCGRGFHRQNKFDLHLESCDKQKSLNKSYTYDKSMWQKVQEISESEKLEGQRTVVEFAESQRGSPVKTKKGFYRDQCNTLTDPDEPDGGLYAIEVRDLEDVVEHFDIEKCDNSSTITSSTISAVEDLLDASFTEDQGSPQGVGDSACEAKTSAHKVDSDETSVTLNCNVEASAKRQTQVKSESLMENDTVSLAQPAVHKWTAVQKWTVMNKGSGRLPRTSSMSKKLISSEEHSNLKDNKDAGSSNKVRTVLIADVKTEPMDENNEASPLSPMFAATQNPLNEPSATPVNQQEKHAVQTRKRKLKVKSEEVREEQVKCSGRGQRGRTKKSPQHPLIVIEVKPEPAKPSPVVRRGHGQLKGKVAEKEEDTGQLSPPPRKVSKTSAPTPKSPNKSFGTMKDVKEMIYGIGMGGSAYTLPGARVSSRLSSKRKSFMDGKNSTK